MDKNRDIKQKISIVLPCYNVENYIERCFFSLKNQTFKDFEAIFINDGSTDNTFEVLSKYIEGEPNFNIFSFQNQGLSQARNEGLKIAVGEYIYFMDPDDSIEPRAFEILVQHMEKDDYDAIQFKYQSFNEDGTKGWVRNGTTKTKVYEKDEIISELLPRFIGLSLNEVNNYGTSDFYKNAEMCSVWRFIYKRKILVENNLVFPKGVALIEDKIFNSSFFCFANKIKIIDDVLYNYYLKSSGLLNSHLSDPEKMIKDKMDGIYERKKIRQMYLDNHAFDIRSWYSGSIFFSSLELTNKLNQTTLLKQLKVLKIYLSNEEAKACLKMIPIKGKLHTMLLLTLTKNNFYFLIVFIFRFLKLLNLKTRL